MFDTDVPRRGPHPVRISGLWLTIFTATLAAVLLGGLILGIGARAYVYWSLKDTTEQMQHQIEKREAERVRK